MTVTAHASGTQSATIGTEHFLTSPNVAGVFTLHLNRVNMAAGDFLEVSIYQIILSGDTPEVAYFETFQGAPSDKERLVISIPISNELAETNALRFSIKQTLGTGRDYKWKVLKHA